MAGPLSLDPVESFLPPIHGLFSKRHRNSSVWRNTGLTDSPGLELVDFKYPNECCSAELEITKLRGFENS
jgi:hypothetical protein